LVPPRDDAPLERVVSQSETERDGRCPYCDSPKIAAKGRRLKKLETISIYQCKACDRRFTPGLRELAPRGLPASAAIAA